MVKVTAPERAEDSVRMAVFGHVGEPHFLAGLRRAVLGRLAVDQHLAARAAVDAYVERAARKSERARVADDRLVLVTYLVVSGYGFDDILSRYRLGEHELVRLLALDAALPLPERFEVPANTAQQVNEARAAGRRVVAVGTTGESPTLDREDHIEVIASVEGETEKRIAPGAASRPGALKLLLATGD